MPSLKEYKDKLSSLKNTRKMTKTMKMVAASKLYKTMDAQRKASALYEQVKLTLSNLSKSVDTRIHPLLAKRLETKRVLVLLITSDKGLCAGFNNNLIKFAHRWFDTPARRNQQILVSTCGRRGFIFVRSRRGVHKNYEGMTQRPTFQHAEEIAADVRKEFLNGSFDEVYIAYNHFINPLSQKPVIEKILPIEAEEIVQETAGLQPNYLLEPSPQALVDRLLPVTVSFKIYYALLENAAGENGARMTAMDNATSNASQLIDLYTLLRNRARQASITKELIEIISGAEALKG